jgi:hypothetical protein
MESLIFLVEKRDGTIKGRTYAYGSTQREYMDRDEAASPTAMTESILITGVIEAKQQRDVMTADIPNAFGQTRIEKRVHPKNAVLVSLILEHDYLARLKKKIDYPYYIFYEYNVSRAQ